ncbi:MAG TPA: beta-N-acetylhexosaminidase [Kofleriaceae bacterium]|nr:beta-N-acetylhexosaminidase [Kofleriaceae bacterium]
MREDIGQLLWIGFEGTSAPQAVRDRLARGEVGATIVFKRNLVLTPGPNGDECDLDALAALNDGLHQAAPDGTPAWIAVDQEGGRVQRVKAPATVWPAMAAFGPYKLTAAESLATQVGTAMGAELSALGFDVDFAPVLDVHSNPDNPVIGDRAFSGDPERVAAIALAFANGLSEHVLPCGKHFPGHGDTSTDSHLELPRIDHDLERLIQVELVPFRRAAQAGLPMLMTAHVVFAAIDAERPATLSHAVITGVLREQLKYRGLVISDDLDMRAIVDHVGVEVAAVEAIRAGCEMLLLCKDEAHQHAAYEALIRAAEADSELRDKVTAAAARVRAFKAAYADMRQHNARPARSVVGRQGHKNLAERLAAGR